MVTDVARATTWRKGSLQGPNHRSTTHDVGEFIDQVGGPAGTDLTVDSCDLFDMHNSYFVFIFTILLSFQFIV
jgi:hypothetical protein